MARRPSRTTVLIAVGVGCALAGLIASLLAITSGGGGSPSDTAPPAHAPRPFVAVKGNHLVNSAGKIIRLLGVDRSGAEYECLGGRQIFDGPVDDSAIAAMVSWKIDAVRVPLNEDCWLGINGVPGPTSGGAYRQAVEQYVARLESYGLVVILDLHWAAPGSYRATAQWPMADADHAPEFWSSVAKAFKSNHGVIFDLFNEPFITSWPCWRNGCMWSFDDNGHTVRYRTAGMQSLVSAVRAAGADQPLMLGGLGWASDEAQWLKYEPTDPDHQLVVSVHTYNFSGCNKASCWTSTLARLAETVPVVTGELGESGCTDGYIDRYMAWADAHGISYLGWTWNSTGPPSHWSCSGGPALISSYDGAPTAFGLGLKQHLAVLAKHG